MDKTMSRLITLKFSEIIFAVFTMLKMNVVIKEIEITIMVFFISNDIFSDMIDEC